MFWNNTIEHVIYPSDSDILFKATHQGRHCLYYDPAVEIQSIWNNQPLSSLCELANRTWQQDPTSCFENAENHDWLANIVKINLWVHHMSQVGSVKPMLLTYTGHEFYNFHSVSGTGSSRLKALERIPTITHVSGFVTTSQQYSHRFQHLESITDFNQFAELCGAYQSQNFWFRLTDEQADYGLDWYEYDSNQTQTVTPSVDSCVQALQEYMNSHPDTEFSPEWFDQVISWNLT